MPPIDQLFGMLLINLQPFTLPIRPIRPPHIRPLIPLQTQPPQRLKNGLLPFSPRPSLIRILNPQHKLSPVLARQYQIEQGLIGGPYMYWPRRRGRDPHPNICHMPVTFCINVWGVLSINSRSVNQGRETLFLKAGVAQISQEVKSGSATPRSEAGAERERAVRNSVSRPTSSSRSPQRVQKYPKTPLTQCIPIAYFPVLPKFRRGYRDRRIENTPTIPHRPCTEPPSSSSLHSALRRIEIMSRIPCNSQN